VVTLRIIRIDPEQRRIGLSLRKVDSGAYKELDLAGFDLGTDEGLPLDAIPVEEPPKRKRTPKKKASEKKASEEDPEGEA
jgi:hypothetical protein